MTTPVKVDVRDKILEKLSEIERNTHWLSIKTKIAYHSLYSCLVRKAYFLSDAHLKKINKILETSFKNTAPKK